MTPDPASLPGLAKKQLDEDLRFRRFLKDHPRLSSKQIDNLVFQLEAQAWKKIDCTTCANCCRHVSPGLTEEDVQRLAGHLGMSVTNFAAKYLEPVKTEPDLPWIMRERPCPFLKENRCSVYEHRPSTCRGYPYLNKPDLVFRTFGTIDRLSECPAVFEVWQQLKQATEFRRRRS
jgi:uncharacterized protein